MLCGLRRGSRRPDAKEGMWQRPGAETASASGADEAGGHGDAHAVEKHRWLARTVCGAMFAAAHCAGPGRSQNRSSGPAACAGGGQEGERKGQIQCTVCKTHCSQSNKTQFLAAVCAGLRSAAARGVETGVASSQAKAGWEAAMARVDAMQLEAMR